jgi:ComF family protein
MEGSILCKPCLNSLPPVSPKQLPNPNLEIVQSATAYGSIAKDLIWKLKSSGAQEAAKIMSSRMLKLLPSTRNCLIVPVPTASSRVRRRGYDQARLIAKELSRQSRLPYLNCLIRQGQAHQVGAGREQRLGQLTNAFRVKYSPLTNNAHIILIDDVVTTGATLESAAKLLKQAGAAQVEAITFARPRMRIKTPNQ